MQHDAETCAAQAERISQRHVAGEHTNAWCFHFARGWLALGREEPEQAQGYLQRALELLRCGPKRLETAEVRTALAMTERQLGRIDSATRYLEEARRILAQCPDPGQLLADPRMIRLPRRKPAHRRCPPPLDLPQDQRQDPDRRDPLRNRPDLPPRIAPADPPTESALGETGHVRATTEHSSLTSTRIG